MPISDVLLAIGLGVAPGTAVLLITYETHFIVPKMLWRHISASVLGAIWLSCFIHIWGR